MQILSVNAYLPVTLASPSAESTSHVAERAVGLSPDELRATSQSSSPGASQSDSQSGSQGGAEVAQHSATKQQANASQPSRQQPSHEQQEQLELSRLILRDQEVRAHEQAHAAIGGQHAGAPTYTYTYGPDGKRYATEGEVAIDLSAVPGDPAATLRKMTQVLAAALAPAEPSAQDRQVAAQAQLLMREAQMELVQAQREHPPAKSASQAEKDDSGRAPDNRKTLSDYQTLIDVTQPGTSINLRV